MPRLLLIAAVLAWSAPASAQFAARGNAVSDCYAGSGSPREDVATCSLALILPPDSVTHATLLGRRARAFGLLGELEPARRDLEAAIVKFPLSAEAYRQLGTIRSRLGDAPGSEQAFARALALNPRYSETFRDRGAARLYAGRLVEAERDLTAALAGAPDDPEALAFHGLVLFATARYREAVERLDRCEWLGYPYEYLALWRALARVRSGMDAREVLQQASAAFSPGEWPGPLVLAYLDSGRAPDAVSAAPPGKRAEASFYLAIWALSGERRAGMVPSDARQRARAALQQVASMGHRHSVEVMMAGIELGRMR